MKRTDYRAVNARGLVLRTFADRELGRTWVKENACRHDGLVLRAVTVIERSRIDYRYRAPRRIAPADPFAIPAIPQAA